MEKIIDNNIFLGMLIGQVILSALIIFTKIYSIQENHSEAEK